MKRLIKKIICIAIDKDVTNWCMKEKFKNVLKSYPQKVNVNGHIFCCTFGASLSIYLKNVIVNNFDPFF